MAAQTRLPGGKRLPQPLASSSPNKHEHRSTGFKKLPAEWLVVHENRSLDPYSPQRRNQADLDSEDDNQSDMSAGKTDSTIGTLASDRPKHMFKISPFRPNNLPQKGFYPNAEIAALLGLSDSEFSGLAATIDYVLEKNRKLLNFHWSTLWENQDLQDQVSQKLRAALSANTLDKLTAQPREVAGYLVYKLFMTRRAQTKRKLRDWEEVSGERQNFNLPLSAMEQAVSTHVPVRRRRNSLPEWPQENRQKQRSRYSYAGYGNPPWHVNLHNESQNEIPHPRRQVSIRPYNHDRPNQQQTLLLHVLLLLVILQTIAILFIWYPKFS